MDRDSKVKNPAGDPRRALPSIDRLTRDLTQAAPELPTWAVQAAAQEAVARARAALGAGESAGDVALEAHQRAAELARPSPGRVVNATGVVLHTNLGRSPLAPAAASALAAASLGYSDVELDLASGGRGKRQASLTGMLCLLSGAEDALVVNNNAGAVLLALAALARGREVIVSRGELVEIGGSFRVPEILEQAGVRLVEVGTTNRTHPKDYERAIGPETGALLKVHRSNFEQQGFVTEVGIPELRRIGDAHGVPVIDDLGSGTLLDLRSEGLPDDSWAPGRLQQGADLVCFSGDKLLGGPQAGIVLGTRGPVGRLRASPMARALRLDKLGMAALDATLRLLLEDRREEIPTLRMLLEPLEQVGERARALAKRLAERLQDAAEIEVLAVPGAVGGGSLPGFELPSVAIAVRAPAGADALAEALRGAPVPVLARTRDDRVWIDARTLQGGEDVLVEQALAHALGLR
ncbi:MAG: L-seryl-tRNA(Sec) selenium transferase [Deltaproteobacteria bacterium]|nr:L-seryl-tRNA(Sec) selenium transferase [Deltaproteobacteria bacterium]MBW2393846.1 L-seryl-tRNA(Sec) selenium transferase [Deltaproteobacteria bacterium]